MWPLCLRCFDRCWNPPTHDGDVAYLPVRTEAGSSSIPLTTLSLSTTASAAGSTQSADTRTDKASNGIMRSAGTGPEDKAKPNTSVGPLPTAAAHDAGVDEGSDWEDFNDDEEALLREAMEDGSDEGHQSARQDNDENMSAARSNPISPLPPAKSPSNVTVPKLQPPPASPSPRLHHHPSAASSRSATSAQASNTAATSITATAASPSPTPEPDLFASVGLSFTYSEPLRAAAKPKHPKPPPSNGASLAQELETGIEVPSHKFDLEQLMSSNPATADRATDGGGGGGGGSGMDDDLALGSWGGEDKTAIDVSESHVSSPSHPPAATNIDLDLNDAELDAQMRELGIEFDGSNGHESKQHPHRTNDGEHKTATDDASNSNRHAIRNKEKKQKQHAAPSLAAVPLADGSNNAAADDADIDLDAL